jgi:hypothetical protein
MKFPMKYFLPFIGCLLITLPGLTQRNCGSTDYRQQQLIAHPSLAGAISAIEQFTHTQLQRSSVAVTGTIPDGTKNGSSVPSLYTIPVVVHILYNSAAQNISDAQVESQIAVLNADYQKMNADTADVPAYFRSLAVNCGFRFVLAQADTNGNATNGIVRKHTNTGSFTINDAVKYSAQGGDDAWDRDRYLNIWVCNLSGNTLGYSSIPGGLKETDGVVITYTAFGTRGTAAAPFNLGRTATHEIGHWLNMIHVWGDADCGDDEVADTPPQQQATYGDPSGIIVSCNNAPYGNMYMDYMDFTDDIGMHMFTYDQRDRMRTLFAEGGFRYPLLSSPAVTTVPAATTTTTTASVTQALSVYPNPAVAVAEVRLKDPTQVGGLLEIYNQVGQQVMTMRVTQPVFQLNVSGWAGGIYYMKLRKGNQQCGFKLVKL